jgi:hypothetical protein
MNDGFVTITIPISFPITPNKNKIYFSLESLKKELNLKDIPLIKANIPIGVFTGVFSNSNSDMFTKVDIEAQVNIWTRVCNKLEFTKNTLFDPEIIIKKVKKENECVIVEEFKISAIYICDI